MSVTSKNKREPADDQGFAAESLLLFLSTVTLLLFMVVHHLREENAQREVRYAYLTDK